MLTILVIWLLGRAQGLALPVFDCAVLFTVMIGVALVPISVGGWGLRELAVVSLLGAHGLAPERALIFSVCFGLIGLIGVLPGLIVWLLYPLPRPAAGTAEGGADHRSLPSADVVTPHGIAPAAKCRWKWFRHLDEIAGISERQEQ